VRGNTNGKDGVAGSIPAGGSNNPMASANAGRLGVRAGSANAQWSFAVSGS